MNETHNYVYAGFSYVITETATGVVAIPKPGQHPAAGKNKHKQAAIECWRGEACASKPNTR